ncbi:heterokaryon incompatibility, partial [Paraphaeosphaeria sporulosa]
MEYAFSPETWAVIKFGYEALSYVWGTAQNPSRAYVSCSNASSQGVISIGQNLDVALRHLRYETEPRRLWIDALCIDQTNLNERSSQVSIMDKVYSIATRTVAWLGPNRNS